MNKTRKNTYIYSTTKIKESLGNRPYALGLDLGVGSIGIAATALEMDKDGNLLPTDLIYANSLIFPSSEGASERREYRSQRNSIRHKRNRMRRLWILLAEKNMMLPFSENSESRNPRALRFSNNALKMNPYEIRLKGLKEKLTLEELGVALYHIANHRGASSIRSFSGVTKTKDEEDEEKKLKNTSFIVKKYNVDTFVEVLQIFNNSEIRGYRNKSGRTEEMPLPTRDIIKNEFTKLINYQQDFYPEILTDSYVEKLQNIIFYENPKIIPEPKNCPYFTDEKRIPKASFINEERRLWEALNNIVISFETKLPDNTNKLKLSKEDKKILFKELRSGKAITESNLKKVLPNYSNANKVILQGSTKKEMKIQGFRFKELEGKPYFQKLSTEEQIKFISLYINTIDDDELKNKLIKDFSFIEEDATDTLNIKCIINDYAPVGYTAMAILMPLIEDGLSFNEAEIEAQAAGSLPQKEHKVYDLLPYYGLTIQEKTQNLMGKAWHSSFSETKNSKGFHKPETASNEEKYGKIANPVVHQTLNKLRKLVNEVITIIGYKPEEITVELGRKLKVGLEKRNQISKEIEQKSKDNRRIYEEYCLKNNLGPNYIQRFKLFEQQGGGTCPYCGKKISVSDIANKNADIDHIFPYEDTADSSENNLVLAHKICNESIKKKQIPHTAFSSDKQNWESIMDFITTTEGMKNKRWRFEMTETEYQEYLKNHTFLSRFKSDNAYIARVAREYLMSLYDESKMNQAVRTIKGSETAVLRKAWNLNSITKLLGEKINPQSSSEENKKNRTDVRHHALDAIVAAYYTTNVKHIINSISSMGKSQSEIIKRLPIPKYYRTERALSTEDQRKAFTKTIEEFIENHTFVSREANIKKNGELIKDTHYSILFENNDTVAICTKKSIAGMNAKSIFGEKSGSIQYALNKPFNIPNDLPDADKQKVISLQNHNKKKYEEILSLQSKANEILEEEQNQAQKEGKKVRKIDERAIATKVLSLAGGVYYQISTKNESALFLTQKPDKQHKGAARDLGDSYCIDLFHNKEGKLCGEILKMIDIMNKNFVPQYVKNGFTKIERLYRKDILEVDQFIFQSNEEVLHAPNAPLMRTFIVISRFKYTTTGSIQVFYDSILSSQIDNSSSKTLSGFDELHVRKVCISEAGIIYYRSPELRSKKCGE